MVPTRISDGSRMLVTGNLAQHETNGLLDCVSRLEARGSGAVDMCRFTAAEVQHHPLIEDMLCLKGEDL